VPDPVDTPIGGPGLPSADSGAAAPPRSLVSRFRVTPLGTLSVVIVAVAVVLAWAATRPSGTTYRTAVVEQGTAVATLAAVGTITPVQQADLTFPVAGTVGTVSVAVGQQVSAGQVLASLDPTSLQDAVVTAQASLASAQATLASDEVAQSAAATSGTSSGGTASGATGTPSAASGTGGSGASSQDVTALQSALVADQKQQDSDAATAGAALTTATTVCTAPSTATTPTTSTPTTQSTSSTSTGSTTGVTGNAPSTGGPSGGTGGTSPGTGGTLPTCAEALASASSAHTTLVASIAKVTQNEAALTAALGLVGSSPGAGTGTSGGTGAPSGTPTTTTTSTTPTAHVGGAGTTAATGTSGGKTRSITPQQLAVDQADVDVAQATLTTAQQDAAQGDLVSPLSGTVGSVALVVGQSVAAGTPSSTPLVVVIGSGADYEVTASVPVTSVAQVEKGQQALVTPDSSPTVLDGTVIGVGVLGTSTTSTTSYPVTIAVHSSDLGQYSGVAASVSIVTQRAIGVTTVPTSAVRTVGSNHVVTVVRGTSAKAVRVTIGTVGAQRTQVLSGVTDGDLVSLADLAAAVPTSSTTTRSGLAGLTTGLGGGGLGGTGGLGGGLGGGGVGGAGGG